MQYFCFTVDGNAVPEVPKQEEPLSPGHQPPPQGHQDVPVAHPNEVHQNQPEDAHPVPPGSDHEVNQAVQQTP